jgi:hypothetical protein
MAQPANMMNPMANLMGPEVTQQQYQLQQNQRYADILMQQALMDQPQGQMVSGHYVPPSPVQGLAQLLKAYVGRRASDLIPEQQQKLASAQDQQLQRMVGLNFPSAQAGQPATQQPTQTSNAPMQAMPTQMPTQGQAPVAVSFPIGESGATQNLPAFEPSQYAGALSGQPVAQPMPQGMPQGAPQMQPTGMPQQGRTSMGQPMLPSVTGDPIKDLALIRTLGPQAYTQAALQNKPTAVGNFAIDRSGKVIFAAPSKEGFIDRQRPDGSFVREEIPGASQLESSRAGLVEYGKGSAASAVQRDQEIFGAASSAQTNIDRANQIIDLIGAGALTGTAAEIKLKLARAFNVAGADNNETIKNTEVLLASLGQNVLDSIKTSGLGAGQGFTDNDRKFLERVKGGSIELNPQTLQELARISKSVSAAAVTKWNKRLPDIPGNIARDMGLKPVELNNVYSRSEIEAELQRRRNQGLIR